MATTASRNPNLDIQSQNVVNIPLGDPSLVGPRQPDWWTGQAPQQCPGVGADGRMTSLPSPDLHHCTRAQVQAYFDNTWTLTEVLFASLQHESTFYRPPYHALRHPLVFYYGHVAAVYVNKLRVSGLMEHRVDAFLEQVMEVGVDEMSWDDMSKNEMRWPSVAEVRDFRAQVYRRICGIISTHPGLSDGHPPIDLDSPLWALFMGFDHERIHLETSSVLIRELPASLLTSPDAWPAAHSSAFQPSQHPPREGRDFPKTDFLNSAGGSVRLGKPRSFPSFGWDNEYGVRDQKVRPFSMASQMVSNGAFWQFVAAGGYREPRFWTEQGWEWRSFRNARWPAFWVASGPAGSHEFKLRATFELIEMPWSWPVVVNFHEAKAFAAWRAEQDGYDSPYRLPTEGEHVLMRDASLGPRIVDVSGDPIMTDDGRCFPERGINANLAFSGETPVDAMPAASSGAYDLMGNLWDWCEDDFNPLAGFEVHPYYDDFSTPCFDGEHHMILGGSFVSSGDEASVWSRFHFRPHFFQNAGFRLARNAPGVEGCDAVRVRASAHGNEKYDERNVLDQYMSLHYGASKDAMPYELGPCDATDFPARVAAVAIHYADKLSLPADTALDVGCAVGRTTFELARRFNRVHGVDLSAAFISRANALQQTGSASFDLHEEGEIVVPVEAVVDPEIDRARVSFSRGDACALAPHLANHDVVVMANLLCRLPSPMAALNRTKGPRGLVRSGGLLVLTTPFSWSADFTPRPVWLGGRQDGDNAQWSLDGLKAALADEFDLLEERDMPMLIREHRRKYEYVIPLLTVWRKHSNRRPKTE